MATSGVPRALCRLVGRVRPALGRPALARPSLARPPLVRPLGTTAAVTAARPGSPSTPARHSSGAAALPASPADPAACEPSVGASHITIDSADVVDAGEAGRCVRVQWADGTESLYPFVWLRDNCQCSECFMGRPTFVRSLVLRDLDVDSTIRTCHVSEDGGELHVTWTDGHAGTYPARWLLRRSFRPEEQRARSSDHIVERRHWEAADLDGRLPQADFEEVLSCERARLALLVGLERYGLVVLRNCGSAPGQVLRLVQTIGYPHTTHYGTTFRVTTKADPINIAYTTRRLNMHADLPYYEQQPQVQVLHYLRQHGGGGGRSEFTDALHVASQLAKEHPEAYRLLADTPVDWVNVTRAEETGRSHHKMFRAPVLQERPDGTLLAIRFSQAQRDSFFSTPLETVDRWYRAFVLFNRMLNDDRYKLTFLPEQGDMMMFDNTRLTHGREDFESPERATERCLEGGYISLDDVRDHRRTLQHRLGDNEYGL